jgi:hypothetical protein
VAVDLLSLEGGAVTKSTVDTIKQLKDGEEESWPGYTYVIEQGAWDLLGELLEDRDLLEAVQRRPSDDEDPEAGF